jgi:L-threonylcarbamoyladenylate synthase
MSHPEEVMTAADWLRKGELVAIPTETVYGLAANALDERAVVKIFEAKQRPAFDPLIVHISDALSTDKYARDIPEMAFRLAEAFWPGPLTLILPKREIIPDLVTSGQDTVGLRMPDHPLTLSLLNELEFPLAAPSANPFGYISPTNAQHVRDQLQEKIAYVLDGGPSKIGVESTIVGFQGEKVIVYRLGGIPLEDLETVTGKATIELSQSSNPITPGQLTSHYAPRKPFYLGDIEELKTQFQHMNTGIIRFSGKADWVLSPAGDTTEAARNLFRILREADQSDFDILLAEPVPSEGLGSAVNDRLQRAAARS